MKVDVDVVVDVVVASSFTTNLRFLAGALERIVLMSIVVAPSKEGIAALHASTIFGGLVELAPLPTSVLLRQSLLFNSIVAYSLATVFVLSLVALTAKESSLDFEILVIDLVNFVFVH